MLGDNKKKISKLEETCICLIKDIEAARKMYDELNVEIKNIRKELDERKASDNKVSVKEEQLNKFKDADGMYNYQLYKQKKMGLGGLSDEGTK